MIPRATAFVAEVTPPARAAGAAGLLLFLLYAVTAAPGVTFWDAGEFIAAIHGLGIPHPPGTPLYITIGRAWTLLLPAADTAFATNLFSAACTAAAGAVLAWMVARWTRSVWMGVGAAVCAGAGFTVWSSATETEVYAASLLLAMLMMLAASSASRPGREDPSRACVLLAFLFGLAGPLHASALLAAPAAALLAAQREDGATDWLLAAMLLGVAVLAAGVALVSPWIAVAGLAVVIACAVISTLQRRGLSTRAAGMTAAVVLGATPWIIMYIRAQHDPALNQGNPSDWDAFISVIRRDQYMVQPIWPRQAPVWLQLANVLQYADWQFAIGVAPYPEFSVVRAIVAMLFVGLGVAGAVEHRSRHGASFNPMLVLLLCGTVGAAAQLNLKAGPTIGFGILPPEALHEPRERDYFFALGFWVWGAWAALGAWRAASSLKRYRHLAPVLAGALVIMLNWPATNRRAQTESVLPRHFGIGLLTPLPLNTVLFAAGDNDTYPLWYLQQVERVRPDVAVVTIPLLGAAWYRRELHNRWKIADPPESTPWRGTHDAIARISELAVAQGRSVVVDVSVLERDRRAAGEGWEFRGLSYILVDTPGIQLDIGRIEKAAEDARAVLQMPPPTGALDYTGRYVWRLLRCPSLVLADTLGGAGAGLLASTCNFR